MRYCEKKVNESMNPHAAATYWLSCLSERTADEQQTSPQRIDGSFALCMNANMNSNVESTMPRTNTTNRPGTMGWISLGRFCNTKNSQIKLTKKIIWRMKDIVRCNVTYMFASNDKGSSQLTHTIAKLALFIFLRPSHKFSYKKPTPAKTHSPPSRNRGMMLMILPAAPERNTGRQIPPSKSVGNELSLVPAMLRLITLNLV